MTESAFVLDGATIADETLVNVAEEARVLIARGVTPGLAVVLVGDNPVLQCPVPRQNGRPGWRRFGSGIGAVPWPDRGVLRPAGDADPPASQ